MQTDPAASRLSMIPIRSGIGTTGCSRSTTSTVTMTSKADYILHHQPFQYYYYRSTAKPKHKHQCEYQHPPTPRRSAREVLVKKGS